MEKIAVISDIHGNLTALDAVLADIRSQGARRIFCLGDLVGKGPQNRLAISRCQEVCEAIVKGNCDDFVSRDQFEPSVRWYRDEIGADGLAALQDLPGQITFYLSGRLVRLFHAHPSSIFKRVYPEAPAELKRTMFDAPLLPGSVVLDKSSDLVGYGDVHHAYAEYREHKTLFNTGSVGNPLDMTLSSYALLEGEFGSETPAPFGLSIRRVPYDIERELEIARESGMPLLQPYETELRTASYCRY